MSDLHPVARARYGEAPRDGETLQDGETRRAGETLRLGEILRRGGDLRPLASTPTRRRLLSALMLVPVALAGACSLPGSSSRPGPDPLVSLADQARADVALAAAAVAADPTLADRVKPLRAARAEHVVALDAEVARLDPDAVARGRPPVAVDADEPSPRATLTRLRQAVLASGRAAADVALGLPADRVGLVASVTACCAAYGALLT
ncbi:MAG: hypothetical protein ACRDRH_08860 [Pseudonocardia sp.]